MARLGEVIPNLTIDGERDERLMDEFADVVIKS